MIKNIMNFLQDEEGATMVEYAIMVALMARIGLVTMNKVIQQIRAVDWQSSPASVLGKMRSPSRRKIKSSGGTKLFLIGCGGLNHRQPTACCSTPPTITPKWPDTTNRSWQSATKGGRAMIKNIGLGLLVARDSRLPLYYSVYPGNLHDSKHFEAVMDEMFGMFRLIKTKRASRWIENAMKW